MRRASTAGALVLLCVLAASCSAPTPGAGHDSTTTTTEVAAHQPAPPPRPAVCRTGTVSVVLRPGVAPAAVCLHLGARLLVSLHAEPGLGDDVWAAPAAPSNPSILRTTSTTPLHGLVTTHLVAVAAGQTTVVAESNAACSANTTVPPCSLPVRMSTLAVLVVAA